MYTDKVICGLYLIEYLINLFISQNRKQFILAWSSIFDLLIFIPPLIFDYDCDKIPLFLTAVSRLLRIYKAADSIVPVLGDTDVSKKIISIIFMLIILMYISAGMFIFIENIGNDYNPVQLYYHQGFYFTGKDLYLINLPLSSYYYCYCRVRRLLSNDRPRKALRYHAYHLHCCSLHPYVN